MYVIAICKVITIFKAAGTEYNSSLILRITSFEFEVWKKAWHCFTHMLVKSRGKLLNATINTDLSLAMTHFMFECANLKF